MAYCNFIQLILLNPFSDRNKLVLLQNGVVQNVALVLEQTKDVNVSMKALGCLRMMTTENGREDSLAVVTHLILVLVLLRGVSVH